MTWPTSPKVLLGLLLAALALVLGAGQAAAQMRIALTFDDVPRGAGAFMTPDERTRRLIAGLRRAGVRQAAFFVNPGRLEQPGGENGIAHIRAYTHAGHVIADHSWSHPHLSELTADAFLADIDRAEAWLRPLPSHRLWFRFPFLDEGRRDKVKRDAVRAGLAARGLRNGYVTADGYDWEIEALAVQARRAGKAIDMAALRDLYVETMVGAAEYADGLARRAIGRSPAHVILLHETDLAALFIPDLVRALRARGWQIVTADEAYADPLRDAHPDVPSAQGTLSEALAWERGLTAPRWYERNSEPVLQRLFAERVLHEVPAATAR